MTKSYFLFCFGNFKKTKDLTEVVDRVSSVTSSSFCKFKHSKDSITLNFETTISYRELELYVVEQIAEYVDYFVLIEQTENMTVFMSDEDLEEFLSLDSTSHEPKEEEESREEILNELIELIRNTESGAEKTYLDDYSEDDILTQKPKKSVQFSLDDILDKINEKGISSITEEEKNFLNNIYK